MPEHAGTSVVWFHPGRQSLWTPALSAVHLEAPWSGPSVTQARRPRILIRAQSRTRPPAGKVRGSLSVEFTVIKLSGASCLRNGSLLSCWSQAAEGDVIFPSLRPPSPPFFLLRTGLKLMILLHQSPRGPELEMLASCFLNTVTPHFP